MQKRIQLTVTLVACLFFEGQGLTQTKSFEILNSKAEQGDTVVVRINPQWQGPMVCISAFSKQYVPNNRGYVAIGVDVYTKPTSKKPNSRGYPVYLIECGRGVRLDYLFYSEIFVLEKNFSKTRLAGKGRSSRHRKGPEKNAINNAFSINRFVQTDVTDGSSYTDPLKGRDVIDSFGLIYRDNKKLPHFGVDLRTPIGTPVRATNWGQVVLVAVNFSKEGNMVIINHGLGIFSVYMHLSHIDDLRNGEIVEQGQMIGFSGATGAGVREPHLHFSIKIHGSYVDPLKFIETVNSLVK